MNNDGKSTSFKMSSFYLQILAFVLACLCITLPIHAVDKENQISTPFVVFTPPKTGTHLVGKCLELITNRKAAYFLTGLGNTDEEVVALVENVTSNNGFVVAHNFTLSQICILESKGYKVIFTLRDPRDQLVSMFDWFREGQWGWLRVSQIVDPDEQITEMITGDKFIWKAFDHCILRRLVMLEHLANTNYAIVRFESLIGPEGQGDNSLQIQEIQLMANLLAINMTKWSARSIANKLFGNSPTFRLGQIGRWRKTFNPTHIELYKLRYGEILINLGYEKNLNW